MNFVDRPASAGLTYSGEAIARDIFGLSTDVKPVQGVTPGSSFTEVDTGKYYIFTNELEWKETSSLPEIGLSDEGKVIKVIDGQYALGEDGGLPPVESTDEGKFLKVVSGAPAWIIVPEAHGEEF